MGLHRFGCRNAAGARTRRHNYMVAVLAKTALAADPRSFQLEREERLVDAEGSKSRPGDVALNLGNCRTLADLTVASPLVAACQTSARYAGTPAAAATVAYDRKLSKWQYLLDSHQLEAGDLASTFQPLSVTALGVWDERSLQWLKRFSSVCASARGVDGGAALSKHMSHDSISVSLWRGNSHLIRAISSSSDDIEGRPEAVYFKPEDFCLRADCLIFFA